MIAFSGQLHRRVHFRQTQRFTAIKFAEIDGLGDVGVRFRPVLAYFEDQPGAEFKLAFPHQVAHTEYQAGALFDRGAAPTVKGSQSRLHCGFHVFLTRLLVESDHL